MIEMSPADDGSKRSRSLLIAVTIGWVILFSYLLLTAASDLPVIGPIRLISYEDPGHLFGSLLLGFLVYLVFARWTGRAWWAAAFTLIGTVGFLVGLEFLQELRPGRGYQRLDIQLNLIGASAGVAAGLLLHLIGRFRARRASEAPSGEEPGA
jgi:VanZ family protein